MRHPACSSRDLLADGHYARKQIFSPHRIVRWSHASRFALARKLATECGGTRLLDYGCGDGTFIATIASAFDEAVGTDADAGQLRDCSARLGALKGLRILSLPELTDPTFNASFDVVTCMEVLEHCPTDVQSRVLAELHRLAAPDARVIVSVPIETGPTLAVKQLVRSSAALFGASDYELRERYTPGELLRMTFAGRTTPLVREEMLASDEEGTVLRFHGHKGFNWRALEPSIADRFLIERRLYSPVPLTRGWLNSQVWFVCRKD